MILQMFLCTVALTTMNDNRDEGLTTGAYYQASELYEQMDCNSIDDVIVDYVGPNNSINMDKMNNLLFSVARKKSAKSIG